MKKDTLHPAMVLHNSASAKGSVLFYILIAVILFAALNYAVSQIMRSGNADTVGAQQASLYADEILDYAEKIRVAVQHIRITNGCDAADISFENTSVAGYVHAPVVSDSCKVFSSSGGGLRYIPPLTAYGTGTEWIFGGRLSFVGLGTDCGAGESCSELYMVLSGLDLAVCEALNTKLGLSTPSGNPPQQNDAVGFTKFVGDYTWEEDLDDDTHDDVLSGKPAGCSETSGGGSYFFYTALVVR